MTETTQHLARLEALTVFAESTTERRYVTHYMTPGDAAALAHAVKLLRAEEVQLRRGWMVVQEWDGKRAVGWSVLNAEGKGIDHSLVRGAREYPIHLTPADALLAADEWYKANVDEQPKGA